MSTPATEVPNVGNVPSLHSPSPMSSSSTLASIQGGQKDLPTLVADYNATNTAVFDALNTLIAAVNTGFNSVHAELSLQSMRMYNVKTKYYDPLQYPPGFFATPGGPLPLTRDDLVMITEAGADAALAALAGAHGLQPLLENTPAIGSAMSLRYYLGV